MHVAPEQTADGFEEIAIALTGVSRDTKSDSPRLTRKMRFMHLFYRANLNTPRNLLLGLLFMRAIAEGLLFREAAATELWVFDGADDISISIDEFDCACDAN